MNSTIKSLLWVSAAVAALVFGIKLQKDRQIEALQKDYTMEVARSAELVRETALVRAKLEQAEGDSRAATEFESKHLASLARIAEAQKKIEGLIAQWPAVEADRAAAVREVRDKETTRPPASVTLTDGTRMDNFVVRRVIDETTLAVEYANGLVKLTADKLPEELKRRLGLGWKPEPPPVLFIDKDGNAVIKSEGKPAGEPAAKDAATGEPGPGKADLGTMAGVSRALAAVESQLARTQADLETQRARIRKLEIFKSNVIAPGGSKTYGALKKEANILLAGLAGRVQALRAERNNLQYKLKSF